MNEDYSKWYEEFKVFMQLFDDSELFGSLDSLLQSSVNTFAFNKKLMQKAIDVSWVEAIENGLPHLDTVLRNPRKTIEDVEEVVPIALSRKITVESVKHLAQHTDLIQSIDKKTGKITPSKILNVYKEESLMTYENKFVNTLVDRLYLFIHRRYEKLAQVAKDEEVFSLGYDTTLDNGAGGRFKVSLKLESIDSLDTIDDNGMTIWQRVEKLKTAIEGYKGSELCQTLGQTYIRPPVMRTNAIMKNVDLKACLTLWQYIESYDKVGYEINVENTAIKPETDYVQDFYKLVVLNCLLFRMHLNPDADMETFKTHHYKPISPKFKKRFNRVLATDYSVEADAVAGYVAENGDFKITKQMPPDVSEMYDQINEVISIERNFQAREQAEREAARVAAEEAERHRQEMQRIEEARRAELERIQREKEEEERRIQEMLAQKRAEQEAEERERARLEAEREARLAEERRIQEEAMLMATAMEWADSERERFREEKDLVRSNLGEAEGVDASELKDTSQDDLIEAEAYLSVTEEEIEEVRAEQQQQQEDTENSAAAFEDPRAVAARKKLEMQREEKERREMERAARLKVEREYFEHKPFEQIRREYSWNPIYAIPRIIIWLLAMYFNIFPRQTDNPDIKLRMAEHAERVRIRNEERAERDRMEVFYRKYAQTSYYRFLRWIDDQKFKKKKRLEAKNKPKPVYTPPKRTPEQEEEHRLEMRRLYREYHVSVIERFRRWNEEQQIRIREARRAREAEKARALAAKQASAETQMQLDAAERRIQDDHSKAPKARTFSVAELETNSRSTLQKIGSIAASALLILSIVFTAYVLVNTTHGKAVKVFGKSVLQVVTGSMEPSLHVGDFIIIETVDTATLREGDIISYYSEQSDIYGKLVTHRISAVNEDGTFTTFGDANPVADKLAVRPDQIVGRYTGKARFFIWLGSFANLRKIILMVIMITITAMALYEVRTVMNLGAKIAAEKKEKQETDKNARMREAIAQEVERLRREGLSAEELKQQDDPGKTDETEDGRPNRPV